MHVCKSTFGREELSNSTATRTLKPCLAEGRREVALAYADAYPTGALSRRGARACDLVDVSLGSGETTQERGARRCNRSTDATASPLSDLTVAYHRRVGRACSREPLYRLAVVVGCGLSLLSTAPTSHAGEARVRLGPEVVASASETGGALRAEPSVAMSGDLVVVAWNDSYGGRRGARTGTVIGWSISHDRGASFEFGGYLPEFSTEPAPGAADSWLGTDGRGNFFLQVLVWRAETNAIRLYVMDRERPGVWQQRPEAVSSDRTRKEPFLDKPAMDVDAGARVAIAYTVGRDPQTIDYVQSVNAGARWTTPITLSTSDASLKTGASVVRSGRRVAVAWMEGAREIWFALSEDEGRSFGMAERLYRLVRPLEPPPGYAMGVGPPAHIANGPWLAAARAPGRSSVLLVAAEGTETGSRLLLFTLPAEEESWSEPVQVGGSPDGAVKAFPSVAMVADRPAVLYYDRREQPDTALTDVYLSFPGRPELADLRLNSVSSDWSTAPGDPEHAPIQRNLGDYITLAGDGKSWIAAWTDARGGPSRIHTRTVTIEADGR